MSYAGSRPVQSEDVVADTWEALGYRQQPMGDRLLVRTQIPRKVTEGGIILTDKQSGFYAGLPNVEIPGKNTRLVYATVIAKGAGSKSDVNEGDVLLFPRGLFARHSKLDDGSLVGWVKDEHVWCVVAGK